MGPVDRQRMKYSVLVGAGWCPSILTWCIAALHFVGGFARDGFLHSEFWMPLPSHAAALLGILVDEAWCSQLSLGSIWQFLFDVPFGSVCLPGPFRRLLPDNSEPSLQGFLERPAF